MTREFLIDFEERRREVRRYLAVLIVSEREIQKKTHKTRHATEENIFKATVLLLTYNAIESSAKAAVQEIYDELERKKVPFDDLIDSFKLKILSDFQNHTKREGCERIQILAKDIVKESFQVDRIFGGNVDSKEIKKKAKCYGFSTIVDKQKTRDGATLLTVKSKRNDLSHGIKSFSEVGKEYSLREVHDIAKYSMSYMQQILKNIDGYLENEDYIFCSCQTKQAHPQS